MSTKSLAVDLLSLFPPGSHTDGDGSLVVGGCRLDDVATEFGTPALVVAEDALRDKAREYLNAFRSRWPHADVAFASKSFPCTAVQRVMVEEGLHLDVAGGGEILTAIKAGADPDKLVLHGNAKTDEELEIAVKHGLGLVVVDNFDDIDRLERIVPQGHRQRCLVRVIPGVEAATHASQATGHAGSKFGLMPDDARDAIARIERSSALQLDGVHTHVGSQLLNVEQLAAAVEPIAKLGTFETYDLGGGLGVRYTYDEHPPTVDDYAEAMTAQASALLPEGSRIIVEPGRSMVATSACTVYRVTTVKRGLVTHVAVDGGMGDNLEVSLTGQRFEAALVDRVGGDGETVTIVGRHCESGDQLVEGIALRDPVVGDLLALPVTGAYCYTMSNQYNGARRVPVVFARGGKARLVVRRDTWDDLLGRDV
jgi:diaminopimelate decarboxylase